MWPSFSLWACRVLKMRSCLRRALAPGRSRARAILVSSVMFFSFSSAIVIVTYGILVGVLIWKDKRKNDSEARTYDLGNPRTRQTPWPGGISGENLLCRATLGFGNHVCRHGHYFLGLASPTRPVHPALPRVLNARFR